MVVLRVHAQSSILLYSVRALIREQHINISSTSNRLLATWSWNADSCVKMNYQNCCIIYELDSIIRLWTTTVYVQPFTYLVTDCHAHRHTTILLTFIWNVRFATFRGSGLHTMGPMFQKFKLIRDTVHLPNPLPQVSSSSCVFNRSKVIVIVVKQTTVKEIRSKHHPPCCAMQRWCMRISSNQLTYIGRMLYSPQITANSFTGETGNGSGNASRSRDGLFGDTFKVNLSTATQSPWLHVSYLDHEHDVTIRGSDKLGTSLCWGCCEMGYRVKWGT